MAKDVTVAMPESEIVSTTIQKSARTYDLGFNRFVGGADGAGVGEDDVDEVVDMVVRCMKEMEAF